MSVEQIRSTLRRDIDADFLEKIAVRLPWAYDALFDSVSENEALTDDHVRDERFNKRRGEVATDEIATAARQCGVPFEFIRLDCNGQHKLLVKSGNCLLIQEPVDSFRDHPAISDYKKNLADVHGYVRQLELDLRDQPLRIRDWSGCVLGVLLHGPAGPKFSKDHRALGGLMLAVPDSAYQQWIVRYDLLGVALYGREGFWQPKYPQPLAVEQEDKVIVRKKRKNLDRESA